MKPLNLFTEPFELKNIQECRIEKVVNEHFHALVSGYVYPETDEIYEKYMPGTDLVIKAATDDGGEVTSGIC